MSSDQEQAPPAAGTAAHATTIKPTDLRGILKYVPRFQGQIFVIALDGSIIADDNFSNLLVDIAVLRSLGIKVVLVHGVGRQLKDLSELCNIPISDVHGDGVTDAATLELAIRASSRVSHLMLEGLAQNDLKGVITNSVRALPTGIIKGVDQELTGRVDRIDRDFILTLINDQVIPVISPLAFGADGKSLRVNSDLLASELADALDATKIIYLTRQAGLTIKEAVRPQISVEVLRKQLADAPEEVADQCRSKARYAVRAIDNGTPRVHLVDGRIFDGLLNEIFSNEGVGTLIYGNDYQQIRKATQHDVPFVFSLTRAAVKQDALLHRTLQSIEENIEQFYVFEIDENIIACVHLITFDDTPAIAEIGSLFVLPLYHKRGIGKKMVDYACLQAKEQGAQTIVALSTQNFGFFTKACGFSESDKSVLPAPRLATYETNGRNAKVLSKEL